MKTRFLISSLVLLLLASGPARAWSMWCRFDSNVRTVSIEGALRRGEAFRGEIGRNLVFRLDPGEMGWDVIVTDAADSPANFAGVVHLPLRFDYTLSVLAWQFAADAEFAPTKEREFEFVLHREDYDRVRKERELLLWPYSFTDAEVAKAQNPTFDVLCGRGRLVLSNVAAVVPDEKPGGHINSLSFRAEFTLPE